MTTVDPAIPLPTKEEINLLDTFDVLGINDVIVVATAQQAGQAFADLKAAGVVGFDTESKPTFRVGEESTGPHVVQFATLHKAYIFQVHVEESYRTLMAILESEDVKKVGFGLGGGVGESDPADAAGGGGDDEPGQPFGAGGDATMADGTGESADDGDPLAPEEQQ